MTFYAIRVNSGGHSKLAKVNDQGFFVQFEVLNELKQKLTKLDYVLVFPDLETRFEEKLTDEGRAYKKGVDVPAGSYRLVLKGVHAVRWLPEKPLTIGEKVQLQAEAAGFKDDTAGSFEIYDAAALDKAALDKVEGLKVKKGILEGDWTPDAEKLKTVAAGAVVLLAKVETFVGMSDPVPVFVKHTFELDGDTKGSLVARFVGGAPIRETFKEKEGKGVAEILVPLGRALLWVELPDHKGQRVALGNLGGGAQLAEPVAVPQPVGEQQPVDAPKDFIEFQVQDESGNAAGALDCVLGHPNWQKKEDKTLEAGKLRVEDVPAGKYHLALKTLHGVKWLPAKRIAAEDTVTLRVEAPGFEDNTEGNFEVRDASALGGGLVGKVTGKVQKHVLEADWTAAASDLEKVSSGAVVFVAEIPGKAGAVSQPAPIFTKHTFEMADADGMDLIAQYTGQCQAKAKVAGGKAEVLVPCGQRLLWLELPGQAGARLTAETAGEAREFLIGED